MGETGQERARARLQRILVEPNTADLWELDKDLLALGGPEAQVARPVVRAFHAFLRSLESKTASRNASRWGAALGTAAVGSVSLHDLRTRQDGSLRRLLDAGVPELLEVSVPALLEVGSAVKSAQAWEVEARLLYDEVAWFLWEELWEISGGSAASGSDGERRADIDALLSPVVDPAVPDARKAPLVVHLFLAVLAARLAPLVGVEPAV